jgi:hypothetical protein
VGARGLVRAPAEVVTREQAQLVRLLLICAAWALGQTLVHAVLTQGPTVPFSVDLIVPAALAIGVYVITEDLGRPRRRDNVRYWRGRPIDDDPPKRDRLN